MNIIGVIGAGHCDEKTYRLAMTVGRGIAEHKCILICGGLGGVMEGVARGAKEAGGLTVGILPGFSPEDANPYIDIPIVTWPRTCPQCHHCSHRCCVNCYFWQLWHPL
ncbi:hypothetical protein DMNBHIDG_00295 [Candidatus Methanoperedenaceae archaeon GB37]|nr:hypothetical protein DMNBHIDG_00295 [Candidatus Methanoperedenaceae archaeon GB37]